MNSKLIWFLLINTVFDLVALFCSHLHLASSWNLDLCIKTHWHGTETFQTSQKERVKIRVSFHFEARSLSVPQAGTSPTRQRCYHVQNIIFCEFQCSLFVGNAVVEDQYFCCKICHRGLIYAPEVCSLRVVYHRHFIFICAIHWYQYAIEP